MWGDRFFRGIKGTSTEFIVGDGLGIHKTRTLQRKPFENRWTEESLQFVTGVLWRHAESETRWSMMMISRSWGMKISNLSGGAKEELV